MHKAISGNVLWYYMQTKNACQVRMAVERPASCSAHPVIEGIANRSTL